MNCKEFFSVDFNTTDNNDILDIHKDLMKKKYKTMFQIIEKKCRLYYYII